MAKRSPKTSTIDTRDSQIAGGTSHSRYRRLWFYTVFFTAFVSLTPLVVMMNVTFYHYEKTLRSEMLHPIFRIASDSRRFMEDFLDERRAALTYVAAGERYENLCDSQKLSQILLNMNKSFGGFVDLGVIDSQGNQRSYVGHYELEGKNYREQDWFHEVRIRGVHVSDVYMGYRNVPHFVIAVRTDDEVKSDFHVLRATIDTELLDRYINSLDLRPSSDAFLINRQGILQTASRHDGGALEQCPIEVPALSTNTEALEVTDRQGKARLLGYAYIDQSPFIFVVLKRPEQVMQQWLHLRARIVWLTLIGIAVILVVILWLATYLVNRIRTADYRRNKALHDIEYTNKMASIGRIAAGVAHEINNPLAIIGENAGLLQDLVSIKTEPPDREQLLKISQTVVRSVDRCSTITHRLLGFAKRMDPLTERIDLGNLLEEVLSFQGKEADYRRLEINVEVPEELPTIESDRGQLQQVFVNILSNAFAAVDDGGRIDVIATLEDENTVAVRISDNGPGIPEEHVGRIFEPFFSTKGEYGTGLGLSITFGIVQKLGGNIDVQSTPRQGASFTVRLPIRRPI